MILRVVYFWHLAAKIFSYASFGIFSALFSLAFPVLFICSGFNLRRFLKLARKINQIFFRFFVWEMTALGILKVRVKNRERLENLHSKVVVANHPSFLDVVILFSLIPNANCIVKGTLAKTPFVRNIVNPLFIPNSIPFENQLERAKAGLAAGESLIVFPEGTRTVPGEPLLLKKGAARFAVYSECDVFPIYIGGNEKIGLRKKDGFFSFHPTERYHYNLEVLPLIPVQKFLDHPIPAAVSLLTEEMRRTFEKCRERDPEVEPVRR